jgi:hypothetical protein
MNTANPTAKPMIDAPVRLLLFTLQGALCIWVLAPLFPENTARGVSELVGALLLAAGASGLLLCAMTRAMQWLMRA